MELETIAVLSLLRMGNGAFTFTSKENLTLGTHTCVKKMSKFGLTNHDGLGNKSSTTEAMIFLSTTTIHELRIKCSKSTSYEKSSPSDIINKFSLHATNFDDKDDTSPHAQALTISESGHCVHFVKQFKCLGTFIDCLSHDYIDAKKIIT